MAIAIMYHDVVERGREDASGFPGVGAARYKLTPAEFLEHVDAIAPVLRGHPITVADLLAGSPDTASRLLWTFDDGGDSAHTPVADILERHGWRGHFFVTTGRIDTPGFLSTEQIRALHGRGHVIGSHSCTHPQRMSFCGRDELLREWKLSCEVLSGIVGEPVTVASVPGGYYSRTVAETAAEAGIKVLFNSEPTISPRTVHGCLVLGRYTIYRGTPASAAAALASGRAWPRLRQSLAWNLKKIAKAVGGRAYLSLRGRLLARGREKE